MSLGKYFRFVCHQRPDRSYVCGGKQCILCSRCMGIHIGFLVTALTLFALYGFFNATINFLYAILFIAPLGVDGLTQLLGWRESNNPLRLVTGFLGGMGGAYLFYAGYALTFFPVAPTAVKLPTLLSLLPLAFLGVLLYLVEKYKNSDSVGMSWFFNLLTAVGTASIAIAAIGLWAYYFYQTVITYS